MPHLLLEVLCMLFCRALCVSEERGMALVAWHMFVRALGPSADAPSADASRCFQTHWVPDFVKEKRFHNWLQSARDWAISRNR